VIIFWHCLNFTRRGVFQNNTLYPEDSFLENPLSTGLSQVLFPSLFYTCAVKLYQTFSTGQKKTTVEIGDLYTKQIVYLLNPDGQ